MLSSAFCTWIHVPFHLFDVIYKYVLAKFTTLAISACYTFQLSKISLETHMYPDFWQIRVPQQQPHYT